MTLRSLLPRSPLWLLAAILALAAILRFSSLTARGLLYWDEGKFALEGVRLLSVIQHLPGVSATDISGKAVGTAKPTHALLIALSYALFGVHDYAPLLLDAASSVAAVAVMFLIARRLFGTTVGLVAATLLAVSNYDVIYARSALSESDANLLFLLGVLLSVRGGINAAPASSAMQRGCAARCWAGVAMGAAFTTNYRLIVYIATLVAFDLFTTWRNAGTRRTMSHAATWLLGLVVVPALWQVAGMLALDRGVVLFRDELTGRSTSYLSEVLYQLHGGKQSVVRFSPLPYVVWYVVRQGWIASILLLVGLALAALRRSPRWALPAALVCVPYLFYSFAPYIVPRNLDAILPFTAILSAAALTSLVQRIHSTQAVRLSLALVVSLLVALGCVSIWPLTQVRSGFAEAARYVRSHGSQGAEIVNEVMLFYLRDPGRGCDAPHLPATVAGLMGDRLGTDYAVIDQYSWPLSRYLSHHARLVATFPTIAAASVGEDLIASENGFSPFHRHREHVDVYALDSLHMRVRGMMSPLRCNLDLVA